MSVGVYIAPRSALNRNRNSIFLDVKWAHFSPKAIKIKLHYKFQILSTKITLEFLTCYIIYTLEESLIWCCLFFVINNASRASTEFS